MEITTDKTLDAWKDSLKCILDNGGDFIDSNKRLCRELLNLKIEIKNPGQDISAPFNIMNQNKKWVYPPKAEILDAVKEKRLGSAYSYSYGQRLFNYREKIDQINSFIIPLLRERPETRRAVAVVWDTTIDSDIYKKDIPSLIYLDFKVREQKLFTTLMIRSSDIFLGWPSNIYQIFTLQKHVANKLDCKIGHLTTMANSAHIFRDQFEDIREVLRG